MHQCPSSTRMDPHLLALKCFLFLNKEYFFQYCLLHLPHRQISELFSPEHDMLPEQLQFYVAAVLHFPQVWRNEEKIKSMLSKQGHKNYFVVIVLHYIGSLHDLYYLWKLQVVQTQQLTCEITNTQLLELDPWQLAVLKHRDKVVQLRDNYLTFQAPFMAPIDHEFETNNDGNHDIQTDNIRTSNIISRTTNSMAKTNTNSWKSEIRQITNIIPLCGEIFGKRKNNFGLCTNWTPLVHIAFCSWLWYSTCSISHPCWRRRLCNNKLGTFTLWYFIIDEISMISEKHFAHILANLNRLNYRPVSVVSGNLAQQQLFEKGGAHCINVTSPLNNSTFTSSTYCFFIKWATSSWRWRISQNSRLYSKLAPNFKTEQFSHLFLPIWVSKERNTASSYACLATWHKKNAASIYLCRHSSRQHRIGILFT